MCTLKFGKRCWRPGCDRYVASVLDFCTSIVIQTCWKRQHAGHDWHDWQDCNISLFSGFIGNPQVPLPLASQTWAETRNIILCSFLPTNPGSFVSETYLSFQSGCEGHDGHVCYLGPQLWVSPSHAPDLTIVPPNCSNCQLSGKFRQQAILVWIPYLVTSPLSFVLSLSRHPTLAFCTATPRALATSRIRPLGLFTLFNSYTSPNLTNFGSGRRTKSQVVCVPPSTFQNLNFRLQISQ